MNRLYNLDYLRGLAASGIMMYHYLSWTLGSFTADTLMGRIGIYGVAIFYILSGLTLYYVYYDKMNTSYNDVFLFFKKRILRIFPLLWLVTIITIILAKEVPDIAKLFVNLSGVFGFVAWDQYFATGAWSIGNELVFYAFLPFFILFTKKFKALMIFISSLIFGLYLYFAFVVLTPDLILSEQWKDYINPLNQVFLFLGGFLIGFFFRNIEIKNSFVVIALFLALLLFSFYPVTGNLINVVTGSNRLFFTACCLLICICFYKLSFKFPRFIHKPLTLLGETSYSVYLLHPILWSIVNGIISKFFGKYIYYFPQPIKIAVSILVTFVVSYLVYQYFEKYFMKFGRTDKK